MRFDSLLVCEAAAAIDGRLFLHGAGLTRLNVAFIPWTQPLFAFVVRFAIEPNDRGHSDRRAGATIIDPDGKVVMDAPDIGVVVPNPFPPDTGEEHISNLVFTLGSLPIKTAGTYRIRIHLEGKCVKEMRFPVVVVEDTTLKIFPSQDD